jgi:hypothetical protein
MSEAGVIRSRQPALPKLLYVVQVHVAAVVESVLLNSLPAQAALAGLLLKQMAT